MLIQFILSIFLLFAISRVVLQLRSHKLSIGSFLFWTALFLLAIVGVLDPQITSHIAELLGIGRGSDVVFYVSIALLYYLIFRLSIALEERKRETAEIVRKIALQNIKKKPTRKKRK